MEGVQQIIEEVQARYELVMDECGEIQQLLDTYSEGIDDLREKQSAPCSERLSALLKYMPARVQEATKHTDVSDLEERVFVWGEELKRKQETIEALEGFIVGLEEKLMAAGGKLSQYQRLHLTVKNTLTSLQRRTEELEAAARPVACSKQHVEGQLFSSLKRILLALQNRDLTEDLNAVEIASRIEGIVRRKLESFESLQQEQILERLRNDELELRIQQMAQQQPSTPGVQIDVKRVVHLEQQLKELEERLIDSDRTVHSLKQLNNELEESKAEYIEALSKTKDEVEQLKKDKTKLERDVGVYEENIVSLKTQLDSMKQSQNRWSESSPQASGRLVQLAELHSKQLQEQEQRHLHEVENTKGVIAKLNVQIEFYKTEIDKYRHAANLRQKELSEQQKAFEAQLQRELESVRAEHQMERNLSEQEWQSRLAVECHHVDQLKEALERNKEDHRSIYECLHDRFKNEFALKQKLLEERIKDNQRKVSVIVKFLDSILSKRLLRSAPVMSSERLEELLNGTHFDVAALQQLLDTRYEPYGWYQQDIIRSSGKQIQRGSKYLHEGS